MRVRSTEYIYIDCGYASLAGSIRIHRPAIVLTGGGTPSPQVTTQKKVAKCSPTITTSYDNNFIGENR